MKITSFSVEEEDFINAKMFKFIESFQPLTNVSKGPGVLDAAEVLDPVLLLHCSIKFSYFRCIVDYVETTWFILHVKVMVSI